MLGLILRAARLIYFLAIAPGTHSAALSAARYVPAVNHEFLSSDLTHTRARAGVPRSDGDVRGHTLGDECTGHAHGHPQYLCVSRPSLQVCDGLMDRWIKWLF